MCTFVFNDLRSDLIGNIFTTVYVAMNRPSISISGDEEDGSASHFSVATGQPKKTARLPLAATHLIEL